MTSKSIAFDGLNSVHPFNLWGVNVKIPTRFDIPRRWRTPITRPIDRGQHYSDLLLWFIAYMSLDGTQSWISVNDKISDQKEFDRSWQNRFEIFWSKCHWDAWMGLLVSNVLNVIHWCTVWLWLYKVYALHIVQLWIQWFWPWTNAKRGKTRSAKVIPSQGACWRNQKPPPP